MLNGLVMPALVAGIHVLKAVQIRRRGWPGQGPAMTNETHCLVIPSCRALMSRAGIHVLARRDEFKDVAWPVTKSAP